MGTLDKLLPSATICKTGILIIIPFLLSLYVYIENLWEYCCLLLSSRTARLWSWLGSSMLRLYKEISISSWLCQWWLLALAKDLQKCSFQLESAQTELMNSTSDFNGIQMTLMGGKLGQLETHLEIPPLIGYHINLLLSYQTGLYWFVFYACKHCAQRWVSLCPSIANPLRILHDYRQ